MAIELDGDWQRLAQALITRRTALGGRKRLPWAKANGLSHDRTLSDLENARRTNFDGATIAQVELIYRWKPGSITAVLAGADPVEIESETVAPADQDGGVLLKIPSEVTIGMNEQEQRELQARLEGESYRIARDIRRRLDEQ